MVMRLDPSLQFSDWRIFLRHSRIVWSPQNLYLEYNSRQIEKGRTDAYHVQREI